ncbi:hypothetical protein K431DRAFT_283296 [Polychaeton citri CBS 116435]|uniref:ATP synthase F(0) complex subunit e, mitochondrial n=1 Tax=Polychaeton citri CBS 116435 TaxID=1314669 RepID=A0A9P4QEB8_9PEZI|nr:hypothetical protein K431DRAFT_283296 [Polychaeton citri CBS 116435]
MASQGVNVLRWGALVFGVFYGFSHQSSIKSADTKAKAQAEWDRKSKLIDQAKAEWQKKTNPAATTASGGAITDPSDPKFDLEVYLTQLQGQSA